MGHAAQLMGLPFAQAVALPHSASYDLAGLGIPAKTAWYGLFARRPAARAAPC